MVIFQGYYTVGNQYTEKVHFLKEKELGSGSFGSVDLVRDSVSGKTMVRKQVRSNVTFENTINVLKFGTLVAGQKGLDELKLTTSSIPLCQINQT